MPMCWGMTASAAMVGIGAVATVVTIRQGRPAAIPVALGYFTLMEALQYAGYMVVDQCGSPANQSITYLSILHIAFQPFVINAVCLELVPHPVRQRFRALVFGLCALSAAIMLLQFYPFEWAGPCEPGTVLCGPALCTVSGEWHIAWDVPYNGLLAPIGEAFAPAKGFPSYFLTVFILPVFYGAWRFTVFHFVAGPTLAGWLTSNPNEMPAIWCLFSIGLVLIALSPWMWRRFEWRTAPA